MIRSFFGVFQSFFLGIMGKRRFYIETESLNTGDDVSLSPLEAHHLVHVLRLHRGDLVYLFNGLGSEVEGQVQSLHHNKVIVRVTKVLDDVSLNRDSYEKGATSMLPGVKISLALPLLKSDKLECIFRMATEMGAAGFYLFSSGRCVKKSEQKGRDSSEKHVSFDNKALNEKKYSRWKRIIIDSVRISEQLFVPFLCLPRSLDDLIPSLVSKGYVILAHTSPSLEDGKDIPLLSHLLSDPDYGFNPKSQQEIFLITGPEGGFETDEVNRALKYGIHLCSLGNRILRAETAPIVALSIILSLLGEI
jgi:16S rRNA (uracil1498-N3)-methyltransferase